MRFSTRKRRHPPAVIIVSMIDILLVVLIFLMVTTTFKQQPAVKLTLPESAQAKPGSAEAALVVTVDKKSPNFYLGKIPVTIERLQTEFNRRAASNPQLALAIRTDTDAPAGLFLKVMEIAKLANLKSVSTYMLPAGQHP